MVVELSIGEGFETAVMNGLDKVGGTLLFNVRLEGDPLFQRCAAVVLGEGPDETVAVVFLDWSGHSVKVESAESSEHLYARIALARLTPHVYISLTTSGAYISLTPMLD